MSVILFRVDERLIHGQVVVGWGRRLRPDRIVVIHDELADAPMEQEIYETGMPERVGVVFWSEAEAVERMSAAVDDEARTFVLIEDLATVERLVEAGVPVETLNVGGMHAAPGREEVLPYVHLGPGDADRIRRLEASGVEVVARDVPSADPVRLATRLT